ncbi:hypothetical protein TOK_4012 [Pseudonocardia sp. N23]|nr:hypothetical protein TOK_4012 [Pseudonocardia sp. N23]
MIRDTLVRHAEADAPIPGVSRTGEDHATTRRVEPGPDGARHRGS